MSFDSEGPMPTASFVLLATETQNLSIFDPVSPPAEAIRKLAFLVFAITGLIFLIVEGVLFYSVIRFRRPPPPPTTLPSPPGEGGEGGVRGLQPTVAASEPPQV